MIAVNFSLSISTCLYHHISTPLIIVIIVLASVPERYWLFQQINTFNYLVLRRWLMSQATLHWQRWRRKRSFQHSCCQYHDGYFDIQHEHETLLKSKVMITWRSRIWSHWFKVWNGAKHLAQRTWRTIIIYHFRREGNHDFRVNHKLRKLGQVWSTQCKKG